MVKPDDRTGNEFQRLVEGLEHWGPVSSISRHARLPEAVVNRVIRAMQCPDIAEEICRVASVEEFLQNVDLRVRNARANFVWEAIEVVGTCKPKKDKGPNYERIYNDALRDVQDALEKKFA